MKTKGQAAMEFLMTYGWAILAAIIVIGVLAVYFRPSSLTSNSFAVTAPFYGTGAVMSSANIKLELKNNGGEQVTVNQVAVNLTSPSTNCGNGVANIQSAGNSSVYTLSGCTLTTGSSASGTVTIYYTRSGSGSGLQLTSTGSISGTVA